MLYVHGPGGIGKSALLRRFADEAIAAGRTVVQLDGRTVNATPEAFGAEAEVVLRDEHVVLLVDTFELIQGLEGWLRERFLPRLPVGALVVLAGRNPPDIRWRADPSWAGALKVVQLGELAADEARALVDARGVADGLREPLLSFAGGHPLALSLGAAVAAGDERASSRWTPSQDVIGTLLDQLVGDPPTPAHQRALEVCAHVHMTTEELLRAVLPADDDVRGLFSWLRRLPFVEVGTQGLHPHDVVRDLLEADLRWRDPAGYVRMHERIHTHFAEKIRTVPDAEVPAVARALVFLRRNDPVTAGFYSHWHGQGEVQEEAFVPGDVEGLLRVAAIESEESAEAALFWARRQPTAFRVYRLTRTGEPVAYLAWLRLQEPDESELDADPIVAAAWAHVRATTPLRAGEHMAVTRGWLLPSYRGVSPVMDLIQWRAMGYYLRSERLAWTFFVRSDPDVSGDYHRQYDFIEIPERPRVGGRTYGLFAHDWRKVPAQAWLERVSRPPSPEPDDTGVLDPAPPLAVLTETEFSEAVREALRRLSHPRALAVNPLARTRLVTGHPDPDPASALRDLLRQAITNLKDDPSAHKSYQALEMTFLRGTPTQLIAAEQLGLPFTTYRRHLTTGVERVCADLWHRELHGTGGITTP
ncbi:COG2256: ATPase related to the helicase subunit of the Holliday junction resolvase [[Actinomadura] parvosata subsp. kistnae]|nr:COG2256: ATPase related to the helicase subunit of the Holliday junction resolvase [Actinomadura parvosata subsp. kistnae]